MTAPPRGEPAAGQHAATPPGWWSTSCGETSAADAEASDTKPPSDEPVEEHVGSKIIVSRRIEITEGGRTDFVEIGLEHAPTAPVTFTVTVGDSSEATSRSAQVTLSPESWQVDRRVLVEPVDDTELDGDQSFQSPPSENVDQD